MSMTESTTAGEVQIAGRPLACTVCGHGRFWKREAQMNTGIANFFGFDWTNTKATCMVCEACGYVHWFLPSRARAASIEQTELAQEIEALRRSLEMEAELEDVELDEALT